MREVRVGDRVRAFDFADSEGRWGFGLEGEDERACYAEGVVVAIGPFSGEAGSYDAYEIVCYKDVGAGKVRNGPYSRVGLRVFAPVNGVPKSFGGFCNGVVLLDEDEYNEARNAACEAAKEAA